MADFVLDHPNIAGAQSYHNTGGMILRGPGAKADPWDPADIAVYDTIGKQGEVMLPAYRYISVGEDLYTVYGGQLDWLHAMRGIFTFSNELFTSFNYFRKARDSEGYFGRTEERSAFDKYLLFGQGTVPWHEVDHPRYGKVEIGGFKKQWVRQPPSFLLEEECHRNMAFTLYHADQMPQVVIESVAAERLGDGLLQVTATVVNRKITPTHAAVDVKHKITPPDLVSIKGKAVNVFVGLYASEPYFKTATEQRHRPSEMQIPNIPGRSVIYVRWLLHGERTAKVTVRSTPGGSDSRTVELEK